MFDKICLCYEALYLQTYCFESESCVEIKPDGSCEESAPGHHCVGLLVQF